MSWYAVKQKKQPTNQPKSWTNPKFQLNLVATNSKNSVHAVLDNFFPEFCSPKLDGCYIQMITVHTAAFYSLPQRLSLDDLKLLIYGSK